MIYTLFKAAQLEQYGDLTFRNFVHLLTENIRSNCRKLTILAHFSNFRKEEFLFFQFPIQNLDSKFDDASKDLPSTNSFCRMFSRIDHDFEWKSQQKSRFFNFGELVVDHFLSLAAKE